MTTTTLALRTNAIATTAYTRRYDGLHLTALPTSIRPNNAGPYYYLVTQRATSHVAFRTRRGLQRWLVERGLFVDFSGIPEQRDDVIGAEIVGRYYDAMPVCERSEFDKLRGYDTWQMSNARWTSAVVTQNDDGEHVVNFMNPNCDRHEAPDYAMVTRWMDSDDTLVPGKRYVTSAIVAALIPDIDGWHMSIDRSGTWEWEHRDVSVALIASLWWDDEDEIAFAIVSADGEQHWLGDLPDDDDLPALDRGLRNVPSASLGYSPLAEVIAARYVALLASVLPYVAKYQHVFTRSTREYDVESMADGIRSALIDSDEFDAPAIRGINPIDGKAGFVVTMTNGQQFVVTVHASDDYVSKLESQITPDMVLVRCACGWEARATSRRDAEQQHDSHVVATSESASDHTMVVP